MPFKPCGKIQKFHRALAVRVDGWTLGELVIAAAESPAGKNGAREAFRPGDKVLHKTCHSGW